MVLLALCADECIVSREQRIFEKAISNCGVLNLVSASEQKHILNTFIDNNNKIYIELKILSSLQVILGILTAEKVLFVTAVVSQGMQVKCLRSGRKYNKG